MFGLDTILILFFIGFLLVALPALGLAQAVDGAKVNRVLNQEFLYPDLQAERPSRRPARAGEDVVQPDEALRTGVDSKAELILPDESVARIGEEAIFSLDPEDREIQMGRGAMLFQQQESDEETTVRTATATATLTGTTVMIEEQPGDFQQTIVLEGEMNVSPAGNPDNQRTLQAGEMVLMPSGAQSVPEPATVDLSQLVQTSELTQQFGKEGEQEGEDEGYSEDPVNESIEEQEEKIEEGELERTNVSIKGEDESDDSTTEEDGSLTTDESGVVQDAVEQESTTDRRVIELESTTQAQFILDNKQVLIEGQNGLASADYDRDLANVDFVVDVNGGDGSSLDLNQFSLRTQGRISTRVQGRNSVLRIGDVALEQVNAPKKVQLYADGSGSEVRFVDDTSILSKGNIQIAGSTVTVEDGVQVSISTFNDLEIYADNEQYDIGNDFTGGAASKIEDGYGNRPAFNP